MAGNYKVVMAVGKVEVEGKIDALYEAAKKLQMERDALNEKARRLRNERDKLNEEVRELIDQANEFRAQRDKLNAQIKAQKQRRSEATEAAKVTRQTLNDMGVDLKKMPRIRSEEEIREDLQRVEWVIQTSVLSIPRERKLVEKADKLRKELSESKALREKLRAVGDRRVEIDALRISSSKIHAKIMALSKESQVNHQKMIELLEQAKPKRKEADAHHHKMLDVIKEADQRHADLVGVRQNLAKLIEKEKVIETKKEERRSFATEKKLKKRAEAALEKFRAGEKVELDELMLLKEFDLM
jgi:phosphoserine phosphatase